MRDGESRLRGDRMVIARNRAAAGVAKGARAVRCATNYGANYGDNYGAA